MNKEIKVSVIVPVYNLEKYIERCLYSIKKQTLENIEIIVTDELDLIA
ncbi:glycosyltransferase [Paenibacillus sp. N3.4]|nr:glycosyltransferase [Paenibacillus sp. N3.4]TXK77945.1 glycosyltransferase [Paenibacillus sp. N3.4]TXK85629.1 glycosyltransferase [Paenibacillus sp. N3.4]